MLLYELIFKIKFITHIEEDVLLTHLNIYVCIKMYVCMYKCGQPNQK